MEGRRRVRHFPGHQAENALVHRPDCQFRVRHRVSLAVAHRGGDFHYSPGPHFRQGGFQFHHELIEFTGDLELRITDPVVRLFVFAGIFRTAPHLEHGNKHVGSPGLIHQQLNTATGFHLLQRGVEHPFPLHRDEGGTGKRRLHHYPGGLARLVFILVRQQFGLHAIVLLPGGFARGIDIDAYHRAHRPAGGIRGGEGQVMGTGHFRLERPGLFLARLGRNREFLFPHLGKNQVIPHLTAAPGGLHAHRIPCQVFHQQLDRHRFLAAFSILIHCHQGDRHRRARRHRIDRPAHAQIKVRTVFGALPFLGDGLLVHVRDLGADRNQLRPGHPEGRRQFGLDQGFTLLRELQTALPGQQRIQRRLLGHGLILLAIVNIIGLGMAKTIVIESVRAEIRLRQP